MNIYSKYIHRKGISLWFKKSLVTKISFLFLLEKDQSFLHSLRSCETLVLGAQELTKQASAVKPTAAPEDTLSEFLFSSFTIDFHFSIHPWESLLT